MTGVNKAEESNDRYEQIGDGRCGNRNNNRCGADSRAGSGQHYRYIHRKTTGVGVEKMTGVGSEYQV